MTMKSIPALSCFTHVFWNHVLIYFLHVFWSIWVCLPAWVVFFNNHVVDIGLVGWVVRRINCWLGHQVVGVWRHVSTTVIHLVHAAYRDVGVLEVLALALCVAGLTYGINTQSWSIWDLFIFLWRLTSLWIWWFNCKVWIIHDVRGDIGNWALSPGMLLGGCSFVVYLHNESIVKDWRSASLDLALGSDGWLAFLVIEQTVVSIISIIRWLKIAIIILAFVNAPVASRRHHIYFSFLGADPWLPDGSVIVALIHVQVLFDGFLWYVLINLFFLLILNVFKGTQANGHQWMVVHHVIRLSMLWVLSSHYFSLVSTLMLSVGVSRSNRGILVFAIFIILLHFGTCHNILFVAL